MLNVDGTLQLDTEGVAITTYDNPDIQNLARAWTGFTRQNVRGNYEALGDEWLNRMDPMQIIGSWRDPFPKVRYCLVCKIDVILCSPHSLYQSILIDGPVRRLGWRQRTIVRRPT